MTARHQRPLIDGTGAGPSPNHASFARVHRGCRPSRRRGARRRPHHRRLRHGSTRHHRHPPAHRRLRASAPRTASRAAPPPSRPSRRSAVKLRGPSRRHHTRLRPLSRRRRRLHLRPPASRISTSPRRRTDVGGPAVSGRWSGGRGLHRPPLRRLPGAAESVTQRNYTQGWTLADEARLAPPRRGHAHPAGHRHGDPRGDDDPPRLIPMTRPARPTHPGSGSSRRSSPATPFSRAPRRAHLERMRDALNRTEGVSRH